MKMPVPSSYPDTPDPGGRRPGDWIVKPCTMVFTGVALFIFIFGVAIFLGYRQYETTKHNFLMDDRRSANLLATLIIERSKATIGILQSYAYRPLFVDAVKSRNLAGAYRHLSALKNNSEIDLTFITDTRGILWANFPLFPEAIGKDLSYRDWYHGVTAHWKPYISKVFKLIVGDKPLAVAVSVPIFDEEERPIGILSSSQRLVYLEEIITRMPLRPDTAVNVVDRAGEILYSNTYPYHENITDYHLFSFVDRASREESRQIEIADPHNNRQICYLTVVPTGEIGWSVIIARTRADIYRSDLRRFGEIGAASFLLFILVMFWLFYLRRIALFRRAEELLSAERKLRQSVESERETRDYLEKLIDHANAPIAVWDPTLTITRFNHAFERLTGYAAEQVIGNNLQFLFPDSNREESLVQIKSTLGGKYWESVEIPILCKDGGIRIVLWNSANIYSADEATLIATIAQGQDITERKTQTSELIRANEEKALLLKEIHHRVKNNLQIIASLFRLRSRCRGDEKAEEILRESQDRIRAMAAVHSMLYKSNNFAEINFGDYVHETARQLFRSYNTSAESIALSINAEDVTIPIDSAIPCGLIINELISNALKHAFPDGRSGEIRITLCKDENCVRIIFEDNGVGFSEGMDFRNTETLGLKLVNMLVEQLDGTIELDSKGGTKYSITLKAGGKIPC